MSQPAAFATAGRTEHDAELQLVRLRLAAGVRPVYVLRQLDGRGLDRFPGADPLLVADGRILAAHSPARLLLENQHRGALAGPQHAQILVVDLRRVERALARPHARWSGLTRGTIADVDDLLWDAAASLNDTEAGAEVQAGSAFHQLYAYLWGDAETPPPAGTRLRLWSDRTTWLSRSLQILD